MSYLIPRVAEVFYPLRMIPRDDFFLTLFRRARAPEQVLVILFGLILLPATPANGQTNIWTGNGSARWEDLFWSLGVLPNSVQSVLLTNAPGAAVTITSTTVNSVPLSLTVSNLTLAGANTLSLNNAGDGALKVLDRLQVTQGAAFSNRNSAVVVGGGMSLNKGFASQLGGSVDAGIALSLLAGGAYYLSNGLFRAGDISMIFSGSFEQDGGTVTVRGIALRDESNYRLIFGEVTATNIGVGNYCSFVHESGSNRVASLTVGGPSGGASSYVLNSGSLASGDISVVSFLSSASFHQNGGTHVTTNRVRLVGSARYSNAVPIPAVYNLFDGSFNAASLQLDSRFGFSEFVQLGGQSSFSDTVQLNFGQPSFPSKIVLNGGTMSAANITSDGAGADIFQDGGNLVVSNTFSFSGTYEHIYPDNRSRSARYTLSKGTLRAPRIELGAELLIENSAPTGRVSNTGTISVGGRLILNGSTESLGKLVLKSNAIVQFGGAANKLTFAASGSENWNAQALLVVTNWNGSMTGGGSDQLFFGSEQSGLTPTQVRQIRFSSPKGLAARVYGATILSTGEVVPVLENGFKMEMAGDALRLNWTGDRVLQSSEKVTGPFVDVAGAKPPYTPPPTATETYFRLKGSTSP